jgi:hypothetical protein
VVLYGDMIYSFTRLGHNLSNNIVGEESTVGIRNLNPVTKTKKKHWRFFGSGYSEVEKILEGHLPPRTQVTAVFRGVCLG